MTLQIGRLGFADFVLRDPSSFDETADSFSFSGLFNDYTGSTTADFEAATAAFRGYPCPDEPVVRVAWTLRPGVAGWYEVRSMRVGRDVGRDPTKMGTLDVQLARISGRAAPAIDVSYIGTLLSNGLGVTDGEQIYTWAVPELAYDRNGPTAGTWTTRATSTGVLAYYYSTTTAFDQHLSWASVGTDYYDGAAVIEQETYSGARTHSTLIGTDPEYDPTGWRIGNGLVRVTPTNASGASLTIEWYDGSAWRSKRVLIYGGASFSDILDCTSMNVLRNSPEEVAIKTTWRASGISSSGRIHIDIRLRRGSRTPSFVLTSDVAQAWRTRFPDAEPGAGGFSTLALAGANVGIYAAAPDSNNVQAFIESGAAQSRSTGSQYVQASSSVTEWAFAIGAAIGAVPAAPNDVTTEGLAYFGQVSETHRVQAR